MYVCAGLGFILKATKSKWGTDVHYSGTSQIKRSHVGDSWGTTITCETKVSWRQVNALVGYILLALLRLMIRTLWEINQSVINQPVECLPKRCCCIGSTYFFSAVFWWAAWDRRGGLIRRPSHFWGKYQLYLQCEVRPRLDMMCIVEANPDVSVILVPSSKSQWDFYMGFWITTENKVRDKEKFMILTHFVQ